MDGKPVGRGAGSSKKRAQQEAARDTLELLKQAYSAIQSRTS
ncbi:putative dsRNA-binding protein [Porphyromonas uenonis]|nr:putative dsRNA-binding protein [Porphyromonas uenonis]